MYKITFFNFLIVMMAVLASKPLQSSVSNYDINCGIAQPSGNTFKITKIGTNVPFVTINEDPNYYFGCTVKVLNTNKSPNGEFRLHYVFSPPDSNLKTFTSNVRYSKIHSKSKLSIKSKPILFSKVGYRNTGYVVFQFDEDDVPGKYSVDVYINNKLERMAVFNVSKQPYNKSGQVDAEPRR